MSIQVIMRDGLPEYAVLPWSEYQALLAKSGVTSSATAASATAPQPSFANLSSLRQARGLSQAVLAQSVGISPAYLGLIESGERDPGEPIRRALARALEVPGWEQEG
jgi:DNA-binding XRE family transcriptional regulator